MNAPRLAKPIAACLTGDPEALAQAIAKIERLQGGWLERIFQPERRIPEPSLLRTHPEPKYALHTGWR